MNVVFVEIRDRIDRQNTVITNLQRGQEKRVSNVID